MYRNTYLEVNCDDLKDNIIEIKNKYPDYKYYFGVVKANAYGHGGYIINSLIEGGINYLAVSSLEEAIDLRKYNNEIPILVLEPIRLEYIKECILNNITITVSNVEYFRNLVGSNIVEPLKVHIKLDTGMSRLGLKTNEEFKEIINMSKENKNIIIEGIFTHFATSGILDKHWDNQLKKFKEIIKDVDLSTIPIVHMGRSLTLVNHEKISFCNGVRLGIIMYGMSQSMPQTTGWKAKLLNIKNNYMKKKLNISATTTTNDLNLKTAIKLYSEVMEVRDIKKGEFVGYGASFIADKDMKIATIPIGYADGLPRKMRHVIINEKKYNIVGNMCMDMISVQVDDTVKIGDKVVLIGGDLLPVKTVTRECGINSYTLFTGITTRVPRVYNEKGQTVEIKY